eukprot:TRINITY_DN773025_c0_g1_i1.p1 TRINITY_DN773025_c0_g1~~TRINITY_DN773025_c0_g1_i1.p1  ORF type:complete len:266 (-),score=44.35 TRINITY_DN773025_c0_g1_i1:122-919(-)
MEVDSKLALLRRLLKICASDQGRAMILAEEGDSSILHQIITLLVDNDDKRIIAIATQAIYFLAEDELSHPKLMARVDLMKKLSDLALDLDIGIKVKELASKTLQIVCHTIDSPQKTPLQLEQDSVVYKIQNYDLKSPVFLKKLETTLIEIQGMVSVTIDVNNNRITCMFKHDGNKEQFIKHVQEVLLSRHVAYVTPIKETHVTKPAFGSPDVPRYLSFDDVHAGDYPMTVASNTLAGRLARRREERDSEKASMKSIFGKVKNFFW